MSDQKKYSGKLQDQRVLIVGGSSGIGFAVAEACVEFGALVAISSSNKNRVQGAVEKLKQSYPSARDRVWGLTVDLSKSETLKDELKTLLEDSAKQMNGATATGRLDHVIYTAGDALAMLKLEDMVRPLRLTAIHCFTTR